MNIPYGRLQTIKEFCRGDERFEKWVTWLTDNALNPEHEVNTKYEIPIRTAFFRYQNEVLISEELFFDSFESYSSTLDSESTGLNTEIQSPLHE